MPAPLRRLAPFLLSPALAALCGLVLWSHTYADFERVRHRVVTEPVEAPAGVLTVPLPDVRDLGGAPAAIVARVEGGDEPVRMTIALDDEVVAEARVPASREVRVDAAAWRIRGGHGRHAIVFAGDRGGWRLTYLEVANVHGFAGPPVSFQIVPRERPREPFAPAWLVVLLAVGLVALRPRWDWPAPRGARWLHRAAAGLALGFFGGTLLSGVLTPYAVLVSVEGALVCMAVLYAEPIARLRPPRPVRARLRSMLYGRPVAGAQRV